jgi:hypothetical protein
VQLLKNVEDASEIIALKLKDNEQLSEEMKYLQTLIDPELLKLFFQQPASSDRYDASPSQFG